MILCLRVCRLAPLGKFGQRRHVQTWKCVKHRKPTQVLNSMTVMIRQKSDIQNALLIERLVFGFHAELHFRSRREFTNQAHKMRERLTRVERIDGKLDEDCMAAAV